jgi:hypothetical protein
MKHLSQVFSSLFTAVPLDSEAVRRRAIHRDWDRMRAQALSPTERSEIDAIFARHL